MPDTRLIFPKVDRVVYAKNPLHEVVCQLRYPTLLRITNEIPAAFQERIRASFPEYSEEVNALVPAGLPPQVVQLLSGSTMAKRHRFSTRDGATSVLMDGQNLTFTTSKYLSWDDFSGLAYSTVDAFLEEYSPNFISRIGLRYQNHITALDGDKGMRWADYIRRELVGVLSDKRWESNIFEFASIVRCNLENDGDRLLLQYGLVGDESDQKIFNLDFDYYFEQETEPKDARDVIDRLHGYSGPAFRWAIQDRLHQDLDPQPAG